MHFGITIFLHRKNRKAINKEERKGESIRYLYIDRYSSILKKEIAAISEIDLKKFTKFSIAGSMALTQREKDKWLVKSVGKSDGKLSCLQGFTLFLLSAKTWMVS